MGRKPKDGPKLRQYCYEAPARQAQKPAVIIKREAVWETVLQEFSGKVKENPDGTPKLPLELDYQAILRNAPPPMPYTPPAPKPPLTEAEKKEKQEKIKLANRQAYLRRKAYNEKDTITANYNQFWRDR